QEQSPVLLAQGLIALGIRLEERGKSPLALKLYEAMKQLALQPWGSEVARPLREAAEKAEVRRLALLEEGPLCERFEGVLKRLVKGSTDLATVAPMFAGTLVGSLAKAFYFGRFTALGKAAWYTRGLGAKFAAHAFAHAAEVPAFALTSHALGRL